MHRNKVTEMGTRMEGKRGKGEDRGETKGFAACEKLESSALLKLPSHFSGVTENEKNMTEQLHWSAA